MNKQQKLLLSRVSAEGPVITPDMIFHVGISGGKDSSAVLLWLLHESGLAKEQIHATWCDISNDHDTTRAHVAWLSQNVHPIKTLKPEKGYFDLAFERRRFPSQGARFCTEELKIIPTAEEILRLKYAGKKVISVSGVRAGESDDRAKLLEWDFSGSLLCWQWRPILFWGLPMVLEIHWRYGCPLNPLYYKGAKRIGCWPCFYCQKEEVRNIALNDPASIDKIEAWENRFDEAFGRYSSFFACDKVPLRFRSKKFVGKDGAVHMVATVRDVVRWSMTGKRAKGSYTDDSQKAQSCNSGYCE